MIPCTFEYELARNDYVTYNEKYHKVDENTIRLIEVLDWPNSYSFNYDQFKLTGDASDKIKNCIPSNVSFISGYFQKTYTPYEGNTLLLTFGYPTKEDIDKELITELIKYYKDKSVIIEVCIYDEKLLRPQMCCPGCVDDLLDDSNWLDYAVGTHWGDMKEYCKLWQKLRYMAIDNIYIYFQENYGDNGVLSTDKGKCPKILEIFFENTELRPVIDENKNIISFYWITPITQELVWRYNLVTSSQLKNKWCVVWTDYPNYPKLLFIMKKQGITTTELSKKSGVGRRQIEKIQYGTIAFKNVTAKNAIAIARALNVTIEDLL